jgi:hypothetical protein
MTTITIEVPATTVNLNVPDEWAQQPLTPEILPALLQEALSAHLAKLAEPLTSNGGHPVYRDIVDFLSASPTPEQIIAFKLSRQAQERLEDLLWKNREEELALAERTELDVYLQLSHLMTLLKARARQGFPLIN